VFIFNILDGVGQVNQAGIDHYNKLINALLAKGERGGIANFSESYLHLQFCLILDKLMNW
jgi:hypothetical protein